MTALKFAGGILLVICGSLFGMYYSSRLRNQLAFLLSYEDFLISALSLVDTCSADLSQIMNYAADNEYLGRAAAAAVDAIDSGSDPCSCWKTAVAREVKCGRLGAEDESLVCSFADYDGEKDSMSRAGRIEFLLVRTRQRIKELKSETTEKRRLYRIVGTFVGALAAAVLI